MIRPHQLVDRTFPWVNVVKQTLLFNLFMGSMSAKYTLFAPIFIPMFMLVIEMNAGQRQRLTRWFFVMVLFAAGTQSVFSIFHDWAGNDPLWDEGFYVGLIANPNSFALVLVMAFSIILAAGNQASRTAYAAMLGLVALLTYTLLKTTSSSQFVIMLFLLPYALLINRQQWGFYMAIAFVMAGVILTNGLGTPLDGPVDVTRPVVIRVTR
jgi:hypothetical protein